MNDYDEWNQNGFAGIFDDGQGNYARFPLPLLAMESGRDDLLRFLQVFSIGRLASYIHKRAKQIGNDRWTSLPLPSRLPDGFKAENRKHRAVGAALSWLNLGGGSMAMVFQSYREGRSFLKKMGVDSGQPLVSVSCDLLNCRKNTDLRELDFRILFALNAAIGRRRATIVSAQMLARYAVGNIPGECDDSPTDRQVRYSIKKLVRKGFFHERVVAERIRWVAPAWRVGRKDFNRFVSKWAWNHVPKWAKEHLKKR